MSIESEIDEASDEKINNFKEYELEEAVMECLDANNQNPNVLTEGLMDLLSDFPRDAAKRCELGLSFTRAIRQILHDEETQIMLRNIVHPPEETIEAAGPEEPTPTKHIDRVRKALRFPLHF
jgi:hypothetical protein